MQADDAGRASFTHRATGHKLMKQKSGVLQVSTSLFLSARRESNQPLRIKALCSTTELRVYTCISLVSQQSTCPLSAQAKRAGNPFESPALLRWKYFHHFLTVRHAWSSTCGASGLFCRGRPKVLTPSERERAIAAAAQEVRDKEFLDRLDKIIELLSELLTEIRDSTRPQSPNKETGHP